MYLYLTNCKSRTKLPKSRNPLAWKAEARINRTTELRESTGGKKGGGGGAEENSEGTIVFADKRTCIHEKKSPIKQKRRIGKNRKECTEITNMEVQNEQ